MKVSRMSGNWLNRNLKIGTVLGSFLGFSLMFGSPMLVRADAPKPQEAPKPVPPVEVEEDYTLGVDDVLSLTAPGHEDLTQLCTVQSDGKVYVGGVKDPIKAAGKTIPQLRKDISDGLARLYNNVDLSLSIKEIGSRYVSVVGGRSVGRFPYRKDMRVSTLISLAGTPSAKTKYITGSITRDFKIIHLDMLKIIGQNPDPTADLPLMNKDVLTMDVKEEAPPPTYTVVGAVVKQGAFPMPLDGSPVPIARAVAEAGGRNPSAALTKVKLQRHGKDLSLNLYPLLTEGKADVAEGKINMEDGDILIIPEIKTKYMVLGQVNKPGPVPMPEEKQVTVLDALAEAGGSNPQGELRKAILLRTVNGKRVSEKINLLDIQTKGKQEKNFVLADGDVLYVPTRGQVVSPTDFLNPLFLITNVVSTTRNFGR